MPIRKKPTAHNLLNNTVTSTQTPTRSLEEAYNSQGFTPVYRVNANDFYSPPPTPGQLLAVQQVRTIKRYQSDKNDDEFEGTGYQSESVNSIRSENIKSIGDVFDPEEGIFQFDDL